MGEITIGVWMLSASVLLCLLVEACVALPLWKRKHMSNGEYDA